ncbi:hypothetical protein [Herbaspirillum camelliae]|uniref:hypothetical protein n=1 Tax=Herbaspirillum camelliae TaxID=1892903 RepID=UPI0018E964AF|nr:hypothetical protein [Herbaspirillum camelliae]
MLFWLLALVALFFILRLILRRSTRPQQHALLPARYRPPSYYNSVRYSSPGVAGGNGAAWAGDASNGSDSAADGGSSGDCGGGDGGGGGGGDGGGGGCD